MSFFVTASKGVEAFLQGQATIQELVAFFIVLLYAYFPFYYVVCSDALRLALDSTLGLVKLLYF